MRYPADRDLSRAVVLFTLPTTGARFTIKKLILTTEIIDEK